MKMLFIFLILIQTSFAAVIERKGDNFEIIKSPFKASELIEDYARLLNLTVSITSDFEDKSFEIYGKMSLTKDQLESYVSRVLSMSSHTMIVDPQVPFIQIINSRDIRYKTLPVYTDLKEIPDNDNFVHFNQKLKFADPADVARNMRPFLSRYGRVIDVPHARSIYFVDSAANVKNLVTIAQIIDVESYEKDKKEIEEINEKHKKILKKEKSLTDILMQNNGIFLVVFMILGLILGFGLRGYMMKRIEGGW